jgi:hypothetical protein
MKLADLRYNFAQLEEDYKELLSDQFWGFEVPATWYYAIEKLLKKSKWDAEKNNAFVVFDQIKEKFGGLRAYYHTKEGSNEHAWNIIDENIAYCEAIVDHTCSKCGVMGTDMKETRGWISLLCPACFKEVTKCVT